MNFTSAAFLFLSHCRPAFAFNQNRMKCNLTCLYAAATLPLFRRRRVDALLAWLLLLSILPLSTGCNYYRVRKEEQVTTEKLSALPNYKRFLVHQGKNTWELRDVTVKEQALEGTLNAVPAELIPYINPRTGSPNRYKSGNKGLALNLVHLHIFEYAAGAGDAVSIPVSAIKRIDITDKDTGATVASHVLGVSGAIAATLALVGIIVLLTKSSCPYVYAYNGENFEFVGESYGGAIFSPLERDDYMPLPQLQANQQGFQVKISNELKERQYTNLAELLVVQHPKEVRVLLDGKGEPHTLSNVQAPVYALASDGIDYAPQLSATDSSAYLFNHAASAVNQLNLHFKKARGARTAKLLLHARNSLWLDYIYGEFIAQFGASYNTWAGQQKAVPAQVHKQWQQEQAIPLLLEVETAHGWETVGEVPPVGPLAGRDLVIPFNLEEIKGDLVHVRLSGGFMFWELDQAGLDSSEDLPLKVQTVQASSAINRQNWDVRQLLVTDDAQYLKQFTVGEEVLLTYPVPEIGLNSASSSFLHTKGYYEHIRDFKGAPDILNLMTFRRPGRFIEFSRDRYLQLINSEQLKPLTYAPAVAP